MFQKHIETLKILQASPIVLNLQKLLTLKTIFYYEINF